MKKGTTTATVVLFAVYGIFLASLPASAGQHQPQLHPLLPDLVVSLKLVIKRYVNHNGVTCFSTMPKYTVSNKGQATAKKFSVKLYYKAQTKNRFQYWSEAPNLTLAPGKSRTFPPSAVDENVWCADKKGKVGFRVIAVYSGKEKSKTNNETVKLFPRLNMPPGVDFKQLGHSQ